MYQKAMLFGDTEVASKIVETDNDSSFETLLKRCTAVKKLGRKVRGFVQETWDAECYGMMYNAIGQNLLGQALTELRNKLRPDLAVKGQ